MINNSNSNKIKYNLIDYIHPKIDTQCQTDHTKTQPPQNPPTAPNVQKSSNPGPTTPHSSKSPMKPTQNKTKNNTNQSVLSNSYINL